MKEQVPDQKETRSPTGSLCLQSVLIAACVIGLPALWFNGFYYQTQSDTVFPTYIFGIYSNGSNALPNTFGCFAILASLFNFLGRSGISTSLYDWFQFISVGIGIVYLTYVQLTRHRVGPNTYLGAFLTLLITVQLSDFALPFEFSKTSLILGFAGYTLMERNRRFGFFLVGVLMLALGFLVRPEPVVIMLMIVCCHAIFRNWNNWKEAPYAALIGGMTVILLLSFGVLNRANTPEDHEYLTIRPYEYALVDFRKDRQLPDGSSMEDSVKLLVAQEFFFADRNQLNANYFSSLGLGRIDKTPQSLASAFFCDQWLIKGLESFTYRAGSIKWHLASFIGFLLLLHGLKLHRTMFANMFALFLILSISIFLKTEAHFITASLAISVLASLSGLTLTRHLFRTGHRLLLAAISVCLLSSYIEKALLVDKSRSAQTYFDQIKADLESGPTDGNVMLNISVWDEFHYRLFDEIQPRNAHRLTVMDGGILHINSAHRRHLFDKTGEHEYIGQIKGLWSSPNSLTVSSPERMSMLVTYVNTIYGTAYVSELTTSYPASCHGGHTFGPIGIFRIVDTSVGRVPSTQ